MSDVLVNRHDPVRNRLTTHRMVLRCLIAGAILVTGATLSPTQGSEYLIPTNQKPILRVFPSSAAEQSKVHVGKFVIFTRESVGTNWNFIAGAWECIPSRPKTPITKRVEFCHSSWNADQLLDTLAMGESKGMHPRFVRLQVDGRGGDYSVNIYDINYRTWDVRCIWQGEQFTAFGCMGDSIFCRSSEGWLLLDAASGKLSNSVPFIPIETDGKCWLVRKPKETEGCWSYDPIKREFITHFGPVDEPQLGLSRSKLSSDGKNRAWVLAPAPYSWRGGTLEGKLILQRPGSSDIYVPIQMQAYPGSGVPIIPRHIELKFSPAGYVEFRARKGENALECRVWRIAIASGKVSDKVEPYLSVAETSAVLDGVPVPDYLQNEVRRLHHFDRMWLAPAFLMHMGILKETPEDFTASVSRDGRHILYKANSGPLSKFYIYGDLITKRTVRWKSPKGLNCRDLQKFVWVETPE